MLYKLVVATAVLLVSIPILAQPVAQPTTPLPPGTGLVAQASYTQATRSVTVAFRNSGNIEITAFGWTLTVARDGETPLVHNETVDILPLLVLRDIGARLTNPSTVTSFRPGENYSLTWTLPAAWGEVEQGSVTVLPATLVIYSDCTAVGDAVAINRVFASRREDVEDVTAAMATVKSVPRDHESGARLAKLKDEAMKRVQAKAPGRPEQQVFALNRILSVHERAGWDGVDALFQIYQARAQAMSLHFYRKEQ